MTQRFFINLSYKGTNYHGWQIQPNAPTVQQFINNALSLFLAQPIETVGCGRTDTGVHARNFVAHFDTQNSKLLSVPNCIYKLNCILPPDIAINSIFKVESTAHARFDAISRTYKYYITKVKNPFQIHEAWFFNRPLNVAAMNFAAAELLNFTQFTTFSKLHSNNNNDFCTVTEAFWTENQTNIIFTITANRFLRNMVRAIVGTLINVGIEKITPEQFTIIIKSLNRSKCGTSAPAQGLFLENIVYP